MTGVFDGMAGVLNGVFGAPVLISPGGGAAISVRGVIRDREVTVAEADGSEVIAKLTTLSAQAGDVIALVKGDIVENSAGRQWRVQYRAVSESPADDRFETFVLEDF